MYFSAAIASILLLVLASVMTIASAQLSQGCIECAWSTAKLRSPTCDSRTFTSRTPPNAMTPKEKACLCPLASSNVWLSGGCSSACSSAEINSIYEAYSENKDIICSGISSPPPSTGGSPETSNPNTPAPHNNNAGCVLLSGSSKALVALGIVSVAALLL
ncbi:MAG: hypothetical protein J3R72DRAFT_152942 [Linnemannia gamsii]|nr:MAG: hypothetical protein J3R72DRAFT_152942 [Linnemannia gamsii]